MHELYSKLKYRRVLIVRTTTEFNSSETFNIFRRLRASKFVLAILEVGNVSKRKKVSQYNSRGKFSLLILSLAFELYKSNKCIFNLCFDKIF